MIDFDNIDDEILKEPVKHLPCISDIAEQKILKNEVDLMPFIEAAENFHVTCKTSANQCLSMSLQARKMRQSLDKSRQDILKPQQDFIKSVNSQAKEFEKKLYDIESKLCDKINNWLENPEPNETINLNVEDGSACKKQVWTYEIEDIDLVPRHLCEIKVCPKKMKKFLEEEFDGLNDIPGLWIERKTELNLRVKN